MATATLEHPGLELIISANPDGEVEPVVPITWTITDELVEKIAAAGYTKPHIVIIVASVQRERYGETWDDMLFYKERKVYVKSLTSTPKEYVQFTKSGENIVVGLIVDLNSRDRWQRVNDAIRNPSNSTLPYRVRKAFEAAHRAKPEGTAAQESENLDGEQWDPDGFELRGTPEVGVYQTGEGNIRYLDAAFQRVMVPTGLFAKAPPAALRRLVTMFYSTDGVDECDFRKRVIISSLLSIPVQLYGIFARLFTLLYGLFMAKRGMSLRDLVALNPHQFGDALKYNTSFWLKDKEGFDRQGWYWNLTPPFLVVYLAILAVGLGVSGLAGLGVLWALSGFSEEFARPPFLMQVGVGLATLAVVVLVVFLFWLGLSWKGRELLKDGFRAVRGLFPESSAKNSENQVQMAPDAIAMLRKSVYRPGAIASAEDVSDNTVHLLFHKVKRAVCMPFDGR